MYDDDYQFCLEHGNFHFMETADPDCIFQDGMGNRIGKDDE